MSHESFVEPKSLCKKPWPPAPSITRHGFLETRPSRIPPWSNGRTTRLGFRITNRESRDTNHGLLVLKPFSLFFGAGQPGMRREERFVMSRDALSVAQTKGMSTNPPAFAGRATASLGQRIFTKHESRDTNHGFFSNHRLDALFTIVHDCSPLFAIVQQKILPRQVSARRPAFWVGLATRAVCHSYRRPPGCFCCGK